MHKRYDQTKIHYLKSEETFDKVLKNKKIDDMGDLYETLVILGIDTAEKVVPAETKKKAKKQKHQQIMA